MYRAFFGLGERPFSKTPDPSYLYASPTVEEAMARLEYAVEERELAVLTGEIGCGKTTLSRALLDRFPDEPHLLIINPRLSPNQFLQVLAGGMELPPTRDRLELLEGIHHRLYQWYEDGKRPILVVDEAQLIPSRATFEEIRLLTNYQLDDRNLLSILLVGQPELVDRLRSEVHAPLRQRVGIWYHLPPLDEEGTAAYIAHRLRTAGGPPDLFTPGATAAVYRHSGGVPRVINHLCNHALLEAFGEDKARVDERVVEEVARDTLL